MHHYKGSEWNKWDLHIHTPESGMANQFGNDWDKYVLSLFKSVIANNIAVIGITDYFTIDGYKKLLTDYLSNDQKMKSLFTPAEISAIKNIAIFPNIEFRLKTIVNGSRINYHIIFSNEVAIEDIEENFNLGYSASPCLSNMASPQKTSVSPKGTVSPFSFANSFKSSNCKY